MIHFVFCGHGTFGTSINDSLEMLLPEVEEVSVINFYKTMDTTDLSDKIKKVINENAEKPLLFVCDIVGGAPFKLCAMESLDNENIRVIAGVNLAAVLEVYFQRENDIDEVIETMVRTTKESIDFFPKI